MSQGPYDPSGHGVSPGPSGEPSPQGNPPQPPPYAPPPPPYSPQGNPQQPPPYAPQSKGTPTLAIVGLVLAFVLAPIGFVLSLIALAKSKVQGGKGLAIAGTIISVLVMVGTGAAIAIVVFLAGVLQSPGKAVSAMHEAVENQDCQTFVDVTTESFRESHDLTQCDDVVQLSEGYSNYVVTIDSTSIENSTATVDTTENFVYEGKSNTYENTYYLIRQDGQWKVDSIG